MGKLAELYQAQKQIQRQYESSPVPNRATQQKEFLEYQKNKRVFERKFKYVRNRIYEQTYNMDQVLEVYEKAGGKKERELKERELENSSFYYNYWKKLRQEQPAVFADVDAEQMNALEKDNQAKKTFVKNLLAEGKIDGKTFQEAAGHFIVSVNNEFSKDPEVDQRVMEGLEGLLSEEQQKNVVNQIEAYQDPVDLPDAEKVTYPYKERTGELLAQMPPEISGDPEKKAQYEHILEFAGTHLTAPNEVLRADGLAVDEDIQSMGGAMDRHIRDVVRPAYQNGRYDGIIQEVEENKDFRSIAEEKREAYEEILREGIQFSEKTKEGIRLMTRKMEEMGLENYPYAANGEDGDKTYGFNKLVATKKALTDALKEGNPEKILAAGQEYEKTYRDTEELYRISREYFNQEPGLFPGNMDSIRNRDIPYAFTNDLQNTAFVNAVFQTYINIKTNNIGIEKYLENPVGSSLDDAKKKWEEKSFQKFSEQAKSIEDAIDLMTNVADFEDANLEIINVVPQYGFSRQINMPNLLEGDKSLREKNGIIGYTLSKNVHTDVVMGAEQSKFIYFQTDAMSPMQDKAKMDTLKNLMLVSDADRNLNRIFAGQPETDFLGRKIGEGFDAQSYIAKTPVDYDGIIDRANRIQKRSEQIYKAFGQTKWLNTKKALEATRQLYTEVLLAHPEDAEKEGFKKMRKELDHTYDEIQRFDQERLGEIAKENKAIMQDMLDENRRQYLIENEPVQELRRLEAQAIKTGDFSKYADFMVDVAARENDLKPEVYDQYSHYMDEITAKDAKKNFVKGNDFYLKLSHAVNEIDFEVNVTHSMKSEELAEKIRNGEVPVDPAYNDVKKDYHSSRILANQILQGGEVDMRARGTKTLCFALNEASPRTKTLSTIFEENKAKQQSEFYENGKIAGSAGDRRRYLHDAQINASINLGEEREDGSIEPPKQEEISERLQKSSEKAQAYREKLEQIKEEAQANLDAMNEDRLGGRSGSDQYKAMYDSLEAVTKLNTNNTPGEIGQALDSMRISAKKYMDKIDGQLLANIRPKGKNRYNFANDLESFARDAALDMCDRSAGNLALNEKLNDQINHAAENLENYQMKLARPEGLFVDEKVLDSVDKAAENLKKAQNAKVLNDIENAVENLKNPQAQNEKLMNDIDHAVENLKDLQAQNKNLINDVDKAVENLENQREKKEAAFMKKAKDAEKALNAMGPGLYKEDGALWEEKMDAFVKVATAKEIERRGGLAAGETHHTVTKERFGTQAQRSAVFDMLKKNDGATLNQMAASPDLKQKLEQQIDVPKSKKFDTFKAEAKKEEKKDEIKRSNSIDLGAK